MTLKKNDKTNDWFRCIFCNHPLGWSSSEMASDVLDDYKDGDPAQIWFFLCPNCGRDYEIVEPNEESRDADYKEYYDKYYE